EGLDQWFARLFGPLKRQCDMRGQAESLERWLVQALQGGLIASAGDSQYQVTLPKALHRIQPWQTDFGIKPSPLPRSLMHPVKEAPCSAQAAVRLRSPGEGWLLQRTQAAHKCKE